MSAFLTILLTVHYTGFKNFEKKSTLTKSSISLLVVLNKIKNKRLSELQVDRLKKRFS